MARYFTLPEAQALVPRLTDWLEQIGDLKDRVDRMDAGLQAIATKAAVLGGIDIDPIDFARRRAMKARLLNGIEEIVKEIQGTGCLLKDLEQGLIDFPALSGDREILLCWKLGEPEIAYWHTPESGFAGREPIDGSMIDPGPGSRPN